MALYKGNADLAQLAEHLSCKQRVGGSNPLVGTILIKKCWGGSEEAKRG